MVKRLYLVQVNNRYGVNACLPYSVGMIYSYARTFPEVVGAYEMSGFLYAKEPINKAVDRLDRPDLVMISLYIWNYVWSQAFAKEVKYRFPKCIVLVGGVHVWENIPRTLIENPQFDFAIYGEGEASAVEFLLEHSKEVPEYSRCPNLIWRVNGDIAVNPRGPLVDVSKLRSPYLDGVFDSILPLERSWTGSSETNRGCPYRCSFLRLGDFCTRQTSYPSRRKRVWRSPMVLRSQSVLC